MRLKLLFLSAALAGIYAAGVQGQGITNPPPLILDSDRNIIEAPAGGVAGLVLGTTSRTVAREKDPGAMLELRLKKVEISNPARGANAVDTVWLRGYVDMELEKRGRQGQVPPAALRLTVPLIEAKPGETVRMDLYNHMLPWNMLPQALRDDFTAAGMTEALYGKLIPAEDCDHGAEGAADMNDPNAHPGCFNVTNNHFHGGWVNPAGNSDNVLRTLYPAAHVPHEYEYNIPADHPAGTFWYHPHVHGSTAIQVASGMGGALIVRGDRWPEPADEAAMPSPSGEGPDFRAGDVDVLLRKPDGASIPDRVFLLQQVQYKCFSADGTPKTDPWNCEAEDIGAIVDTQNIGASNWDASGRFTTVNGHIAGVPGIGGDAEGPVVAGQPERWRFIHAGFNDTIKLQVFPAASPESRGGESLASRFRNVSAQEAEVVIEDSCIINEAASDDSALEVFEIAADGLTRVQAQGFKSRTLQPGYRSDLLVSFPQPPEGQPVQEYCVVAMPNNTDKSVEGSIDRKRLLFTVTVQRAQGNVPDAATAIRNMMVIAATQEAVKRVQDGKGVSLLPAILTGLFDGLKLDHFSPHDTLTGETAEEQQAKWQQVQNVRMLRFNLFQSVNPNGPEVPGGPNPGIGHKRLSMTEYEDDAGDNAMSGPVPAALWTTFEDFRFSTQPGKLIALQLGDIDEWRLRTEDIPHPFHIHVNPFQVVRVTRLSDGADLTEDAASQYYGMKGVFKDTIMVERGVEVVIRSHYERYIGRFVLHCHILMHEDAGMMRLVEIFDPSLPGGLARIESQAAGHGH